MGDQTLALRGDVLPTPTTGNAAQAYIMGLVA